MLGEPIHHRYVWRPCIIVGQDTKEIHVITELDGWEYDFVTDTQHVQVISEHHYVKAYQDSMGSLYFKGERFVARRMGGK